MAYIFRIYKHEYKAINVLALRFVINLISYISGISLLAKHKYEAIKYFSLTSCNISYSYTYITLLILHLCL